ncbi:MAG: 16S rRNA methyltransferase, partial [Rhodospirillaceae bacterium BRH_c57]
APKGEAVVVIGPPGSGGTEQAEPDLDALLRAALKHQTVRDAAATVAAATGLKKREVYARALELSDDQ